MVVGMTNVGETGRWSGRLSGPARRPDEAGRLGRRDDPLDEVDGAPERLAFAPVQTGQVRGEYRSPGPPGTLEDSPAGGGEVDQAGAAVLGVRDRSEGRREGEVGGRRGCQ